MKRFNICTTFGQTFLRGTKHEIEVPRGTFYGKDEKGLWYSIDRSPVIFNGRVYLEIYRFINSRWQVALENSDTVDLIFKIANEKKLWNIPLKKCLHMNSAVQSRVRTPGSVHTKSLALKDVSRQKAITGTYKNIY